RIWIIAGVTDIRCGFNGLASKVQNTLKDDPFSGHIFVLRGRSGKMVKILWADRDGLCLFARRLERGRFVWPVTREGKVHLQAVCCTMNSYPGPELICYRYVSKYIVYL
ncbi:IS66 family insertion sequence element accessory protein TnpB, partial [Salmonella enterica]|nr:IS66 family insertion sequence element accessory protein TnpB [Salmonella enterica]EIE2750459.1 IS66 family insertion sequence element accessory protein TnpB [Salmonella enterica subsp. diarizonae serovar 48:i:z]EKP8944998.1 IS66 family insertion sequence element accessory protein TnpB [Salmonella enterica]EKQ9928281.1 IS66 family insertion sequence element accessory protein TnpB [Salmonella enterica subsp. enterica serovar Panama]ELS5098551.1 IS66 family insertion sequence element accessory